MPKQREIRPLLYHDGAEELDWNEVWRSRRARNRELRGTEDESVRRFEGEAAARRYAGEADRSYQQRVTETLGLLPLTPGARVLDIGAGPGTLAIPAARSSAHVTAVEPAPGMGSVLEERVRAARLTNVTLVAKRWEEVVPSTDLVPPYEIVIASFSLAMEDLRAALGKMDQVASGGVYLFSFADMPLWERMAWDLWEDLHGRPYLPSPKTDVIWNLLEQMGIFANILFRPLSKSYAFGTVDEAAAFFARRVRAVTPPQQAVLRGYLEEANMAADEGFLLAAATTYAAIWWEKGGSDPG